MIPLGERIAGSRIGQRCIHAWRYAVARDILRLPPLRLPPAVHGQISIPCPQEHAKPGMQIS